MNNSFKWRDHAESIHSRVFAGLRSLWPFSDSTPTKTREMLARSLLIPHFEYCSSVYAYGLDYGAKTLLTNAFNAVVRYVYGLRRHVDVSSHAIRFIGCPLLDFLKFRDMAFLYNLIRTKSPRYLSDLIKINHASRTKQAEIPIADAMLRDTIFGKGLVDWNLLPVRIRTSSSRELFRKRYFERAR